MMRRGGGVVGGGIVKVVVRDRWRWGGRGRGRGDAVGGGRRGVHVGKEGPEERELVGPAAVALARRGGWRGGA
jgi:hypothetical protein